MRGRAADGQRAETLALRDARTGLAFVDGAGGGVFTERDLLKAIAQGVDLDTTPVGDHMTPDPAVVTPEVPLDEACDLMIARGVRHLLVAGEDDIIGVVNMRDVVGVLSGGAVLGEVPPAKER
ncbi:MAG TPA: CBS domain-containing protein [Miltoncostaeaceae bacterium]|nr:CBS domain-containing protein [Miltoncostaeaceae bacterium]